ncbi:MAG TPA: sugar phosphate isomerase/epimerase family protein [Levilinea sp.]|nr:sugar phosphate isomerase/epimerase family protein [Levilinea sp.]
MKLKHAIMVGMMGRIADRFHEYQPASDLARRLEMCQKIKDIDGIEVVYPQDFSNVQQTIQMVKDMGLAVSALNLNVKGEKKWQSGSFTNADPQLRREAIDYLKCAMDLAADLGTDMVTCCPLIDGHNYAFEVDYLKQWIWLEEGIGEASRHRSDIRVSLEYKLNESRNYNILSDMGRSLFLCQKLGLPNVGVTVDVGHALIAKETPAEALSLGALNNRLFYVHFNDNAREWDWDMLPGSVNVWDLVEVVFYLKRLEWSGWLSYDVAMREGTIVDGMSASISILKSAETLVDKISMETLEGYIKDALPSRTFSELMKHLL